MKIESQIYAFPAYFLISFSHLLVEKGLENMPFKGQIINLFNIFDKCARIEQVDDKKDVLYLRRDEHLLRAHF